MAFSKANALLVLPEELDRLEDAGLSGIVHIPFKFGLGCETSPLDQKWAYLEKFASEVISRDG